MAQKTDNQLTTEANIIRDETIIGANTALRVGTMFDDIIENKINNDKISDDVSLGNDPTLVPSQNAVKTYVDAFATGLLTDNGNYDPTITSQYPTSGNTLSGGAVKKGDLWYISADGTINGNSVLVGYSVRALIDNAGATTDADWSISNVGIGYVPENVANKSTDTTLGTSDIYYPSQNAVKTYVDTQVAAAVPYTPENIANKSQDITANPSSTVLYPSNKAVADYVNLGISLQTVTDNGNTTTNDIHILNSIASENATDLAAAYLNNVVGDGGVIGIQKADGTKGEIKGTNLTANRNYELPDQSGTLALLSDIPTPTSSYLVYTALLEYNGGSPIATILQNTLGTTINWTNPANGTLFGTAASGTPFTLNKTWVVGGAYNNGGQPYFTIGSATGLTNIVNVKLFLYDGTITGTPNFSNLQIEIRVYP